MKGNELGLPWEIIENPEKQFFIRDSRDQLRFSSGEDRELLEPILKAVNNHHVLIETLKDFIESVNADAAIDFPTHSFVQETKIKAEELLKSLGEI